MLWRDRRQSGNVEDRRGIGRGGGMAIGGLGGLVLLVLALLFGVDPSQLLEQVPQNDPNSGAPRATNPAEEELKKFTETVLADTEDVWNEVFRQMGTRYQEPKLVLFTDQVRSGCGIAGAAVGPFYCPPDQKAYIDLAFYNDLKSRFKAPGDFAQAYVIAHEIGHHVQNLLGTMEKVNSAQQRVSKADANKLSVMLELQADFLAGVWAHHAQLKGVLESGDIEEALGAASAIGDDRIQRQQQGYVVPDSFTHGTSEQRIRWFKKGFETGDIRQGDTFNARIL
ncbi:MAG TPA: neutral zinc metallopeptidase [Blastocatellia bacterium]|nr:neutral zinc metallopeptidase [Blastocatellia bacterium]